MVKCKKSKVVNTANLCRFYRFCMFCKRYMSERCMTMKEKSEARGAVVATFCNQKGGQGKTSAVTAFAWGLARKGRRVLAIDFDAQATLTSNLAGDGWEGDAIDSWVIDGNDVRVRISDLIDLVPASLDGVVRLEQHMARNYVSVALFLTKALKAAGYADDYDFVLIDTSSNVNLPLTNALAASNAVVIPAEPRHEGMVGFEKVWDVVEAVAEMRTGREGASPSDAFDSLGLFIHAFKEQPRGHRDMLGEIALAAEGRGCSVYRSLIHENEPMADALGQHIDPFTRRNRIRAVREYESLIDEFEASTNGDEDE